MSNKGFVVGMALGSEHWAIIVDGDSVLCEFPGSNGQQQAEIVCNALNAANAANKDLQGIS